MSAKLLALCAFVALVPASTTAAPIVVAPPPGTPTRENTHFKSVASGLDCPTCELIIGAAQSLAQNATSLAQFVQLMDVGCAMLFPNDNSTVALCQAVVTDVAGLLPWLDKQLETLAWDIPRTFCSVFIPVCTNPCCATATQPEQVHLSLTGDFTEMRVVWVTLNDTATSTVRWDVASKNPTFTYSATGTTRTYTFGGWLGVIHLATMTGLVRGQAYSYQVGDAAGGWSQTFNFSVLPTNIGTASRPLRIINIGDMAYDNASDQTVATMSQLTAAGLVDIVLHVGDVSYADGEQPHWDMFWRKVQPIAASVPYMTVAGNHEMVWQGAVALTTRTSMPMEAQTNNLYYSLDIGTIHLYMGNTETVIDTANFDATQLAFMQSDLSAANANRNVTPWVIATGHRPLYCSNHDKTQCGLFAAILRYQAEDIFYGNKVDLVVGAHEHDYERSYPLYNSTVVSTSYASPAAPVYVVNGAAGNREGNSMPAGADWSVFQSQAIGFAQILVAGPHALTTTFYAANGTQLDTFTITK